MTSPAAPERWHDATAVRIALALAAVMVAVAAVAWVLSDRDPSAEVASGQATTTTDAEVPVGALGDAAGASPGQRVAAQDLLADVRAAAPAFATVDQAGAAGYTSLGDAFSGVEHFTSWAAIADGAELDVDRPEGLLYDVGADGDRTLLAVLFMRPAGSQVSEAPRVGGPLTRWYAWNDLCGDTGPPPTIAAASDATGRCPAGLVQLAPFPTLHVWVVAHSCGPFSELERAEVRRGTSAEGCVHRHGG